MKQILAGIVLAVLAVSTAWGHGTEGEIKPAQGILVFAAYDDGEPMSYAAIEITGPDSPVPFQKGRTDRNGRFMFSPDRKGTWQIAVNDQLGHRLAMSFEATAMDFPSPDSQPDARKIEPGFSRSAGIITGLAVIFGLSGLACAWKARQKPER